MSVLGEIVARTRADLALRRERRPEAEVEACVAPSTRSFADALRAPGLGLIAEFKRRSPSRGDIRPGASVEDVVGIYDRYAAAISVLCDAPYFGGGPELLAAAREVTERPLLYKGFVVSTYQVLEAREAGADAVLLMASVLDDETLRRCLARARELRMDALVEAHDDAELDRAIALGADVIGVNSRDLHTLDIDRAAMRRRLDRVPDGVVRVAESGVSSAEQVDELRGKADAVLIGTALMAAADIEARIDALGWEARA